MKTTLFSILTLFSALVFSQNPCPTDSIGGGGNGIASLDTIIIGDIVPRCVTCPADSCAGDKIPYAFNGDVYAYSPNGATVNIRITTQCNLLLWDTCATLQPRSMGTFLLKRFAVSADAQILFCGNVGDTIELECKISAIAKELLDTPILDLTTCNPPTSILPSLHPQDRPKTYWQFDGYYFREVAEKPRNAMYLER